MLTVWRACRISCEMGKNVRMASHWSFDTECSARFFKLTWILKNVFLNVYVAKVAGWNRWWKECSSQTVAWIHTSCLWSTILSVKSPLINKVLCVDSLGVPLQAGSIQIHWYRILIILKVDIVGIKLGIYVSNYVDLYRLVAKDYQLDTITTTKGKPKGGKKPKGSPSASSKSTKGSKGSKGTIRSKGSKGAQPKKTNRVNRKAQSTETSEPSNPAEPKARKKAKKAWVGQCSMEVEIYSFS